MILLVRQKKNLAKRYFANVIDYLIFFVLSGVYILFVGEDDGSGTYRVHGLKALAEPLFWFLYFPLCEGTVGQTIGKKAFHLRVVDLQGRTPSLVQGFLRRLFDIFELAFLGLPSLITINSLET